MRGTRAPNVSMFGADNPVPMDHGFKSHVMWCIRAGLPSGVQCAQRMHHVVVVVVFLGGMEGWWWWILGVLETKNIEHRPREKSEYGEMYLCIYLNPSIQLEAHSVILVVDKVFLTVFFVAFLHDGDLPWYHCSVAASLLFCS